MTQKGSEAKDFNKKSTAILHFQLLFFNFLFEIAGFIMAEMNVLTLFAIKYLTALGAFFIRRHIPRGKITGRIFLTAIKYRFIFAVFHNYFRSAFRARNANLTSFLLCKATRRES